MIKKTVKELEKEVKKLRLLKEKGKFSLQQSENSLKRLSQTLLNLYLTKYKQEVKNGRTKE